MICQAEIFPIVVAKRTWLEHLSHGVVLWFIDNSSAQAALIRSFFPISENYELLVAHAKLDVEMQTLHWYSRVPSQSNPGDDHSRFRFDVLDAKDMHVVSCATSFTKIKQRLGWQA